MQKAPTVSALESGLESLGFFCWDYEDLVKGSRWEKGAVEIAIRHEGRTQLWVSAKHFAVSDFYDFEDTESFSPEQGRLSMLNATRTLGVGNRAICVKPIDGKSQVVLQVIERKMEKYTGSKQFIHDTLDHWRERNASSSHDLSFIVSSLERIASEMPPDL